MKTCKLSLTLLYLITQPLRIPEVPPACFYTFATLWRTLWDPMDCNMPVFPVLFCLPELAQAHIHWEDDAVQSISSSVACFSSCPQFFPVSGSFTVSQLFATGGQSIEASTSTSVLPMNIQGWFPLGLTGLVSLQSKGFSRVFSSITIWKHQFFDTQPSLLSNSHIRMSPLEKPKLWL